MRGWADRCWACCTGRMIRASVSAGSVSRAGSGRTRGGSPAGLVSAAVVVATRVGAAVGTAGASLFGAAVTGALVAAAVTVGFATAGAGAGCEAAGFAATVVVGAADFVGAGAEAKVGALPAPMCHGVICAPGSVAMLTWTSFAVRQMRYWRSWSR